MLDLTFGEQVKIILSRKGMTIKELAEMIEERTGKKMSRQNLTQRLGRDNFQEQDMRMIAEILGCPFQLNILGDARQPENTDEESVHVTEAELMRLEKKKGKKHRHPVERDITIGELVDLNSGLDQLLEEKEELLGEEIALDAARPEAEQEDAAEAVVAEERVTEAAVAEEQTEEAAASVAAASEEAMPEDAAPEETVLEETVPEETVPEEMAAEATVEETVEEETPQERPAKKARGSWRDFFQRRTRKEPKEHVAQTEAERQTASPAAAREDVKLQEEPEEVPDEHWRRPQRRPWKKERQRRRCIPRRREKRCCRLAEMRKRIWKRARLIPTQGMSMSPILCACIPRGLGTFRCMTGAATSGQT